MNYSKTITYLISYSCNHFIQFIKDASYILVLKTIFTKDDKSYQALYLNQITVLITPKLFLRKVNIFNEGIKTRILINNLSCQIDCSLLIIQQISYSLGLG